MVSWEAWSAAAISVVSARSSELLWGAVQGQEQNLLELMTNTPSLELLCQENVTLN